MTETLPHIDEIDDAIEQAVRWHEQGVSLCESGELVAAGELLDRVCRVFEVHFGSECPDVANVLNARGLVAIKLGDLPLAQALFERAVKITQPVLAETDPDRDVVRIHVQALNNLGQLERSGGQYDVAGRIFDEALHIARRWMGETDLDTAMVLNSLGMWCKFTGRFERGREVYRQALEILRINFGSDDSDPSIATLYHNLGGLEHTAGNFATGEPLAHKSVEIRRRALGTSHPDYAGDVGGLAAIVADLGKHDEAESLYREALAIFERVYGDDHYEIAVLLHNLAAVEVGRERFDSAWDLYRRSAAMKQRWLGPDHPDLGLTLHNLAVLAIELDRTAEATTYCRQALTIFEQNLVETHPSLIACRECWSAIASPVL